MKKIVIVGSSGHAKVIIDIVHREGKYKIVGLLDRFRKVGEETLGYKILGKEENIAELMKSHALEGVFVAIGDNFYRAKSATLIRGLCPSLPFVSVIHPGAIIGESVSVGAGSAVMAGVCIASCVSIGKFCILNTNSSIDHDSTLGDYGSLAPGVTTGGKCQIGQYSAIGVGAILTSGACVGEHTIVGAGSLVLKPVDSFVTAYGVPARMVSNRKAGDRYL